MSQVTSWDHLLRQAAEHFEAGNFQAAAELFYQICNDIQIPAGERAYMCMNLALTYDKMGLVQEAADSYQFAVTLALQPLMFVQTTRATYLIEHGRAAEAIAIIEELLSLEALSPEDRAACEQNLAEARRRLNAPA